MENSDLENKIREAYNEGTKCKKPWYRTRKGIIKDCLNKIKEITIFPSNNTAFNYECLNCGEGYNVYDVEKIIPYPGSKTGKVNLKYMAHICLNCGHVGDSNGRDFESHCNK
jgi:hypothetical protein